MEKAYDLPQLLWHAPTDCFVNALRPWNLPFGGWTVFLAHHPYVKFYSGRTIKLSFHPGWQSGCPRPHQQGFQELDLLQSNMVYYEPERVICLYCQASLGANFMDAYMQAMALRQARQDALRQRSRFPVELLIPLAVTDANRKSLASTLEAPGSEAASAQAVSVPSTQEVVWRT